jgi:diguanylate cyclase (GGDEF)-like protein/PAS domain S-box-containing protein
VDADLFSVMLEETAPGVFDVARAATLEEATAYLQASQADCALVDLGLPDADGARVIAVLAIEAPAVALIALTAGDDDLGAALVAEAIDCLPRGALDGKLLVRAIRYAILRKRAESSMAEAQSVARVGSWDVDVATNTATWSQELYRLFGFRPDEKPTYEGLLDRTHPDDRAVCIQAIRATMEGFTPFSVEHRVLLPDGALRWVRTLGHVELDRSGRPERLLGTAQDITERRVAEEALVHQTLHDALSGLPNRVLLLDRLSHSLARLARRPSTVGVIYLDIDRFKVVNDSVGHSVGDEMLATIAARLRRLVRPGDTLARVGGDEFAMLCERLSCAAEAVGIADRLRAAAAEPLAWGGGELVMSVSAGVAVADSPAVSAVSLLTDANAAMYSAKGEGRARTAVFAESMRVQAVGRLDAEVSLRRAIADGELRIHYQPIVNLVDGEALGHEALVRWEHPTLGLLGPDEFITIAEETGLIVPLGAWVLREACHQARRFQSRGARWSELTMSVNLSGAQLGQPDLVELVASAMDDAGLRPEYLQLEMTESVLMGDAATTITILQALKGLGVRLGVDDFGTGFSSLAYLKRFPVDVLKIDRSFVSGLGDDLEDSAIVAAVVSLADTIGLTVVAEGVETDLQRGCLISLGCQEAQGYLFCRPVPAPDAEMALITRRRAGEAQSVDIDGYAGPAPPLTLEALDV